MLRAPDLDSKRLGTLGAGVALMEKGRFAAVWETFPVGTQSTTPGNVLTKHFLSGLERVKPEAGDPGGRRLTGEAPPSSGRVVGSRGESLHMFQTENQAELDQWLAGVGGRRAAPVWGCVTGLGDAEGWEGGWRWQLPGGQAEDEEIGH